MKRYMFTCPLQNCGVVMSRDGESPEEGVTILSNMAQQHLKDVHPDIHKTREEVEADIKEHMVIGQKCKKKLSLASFCYNLSMEEESTRQYFSYSKIILGSLLVVITILLAATFSMSILAQSRPKIKQVLAVTKPSPTATPTPTPIPTATPTSIPTATPTPAPTVDPTNDVVWNELAACESGGNWGEDTGNGYYGGLQFSQGAWESVGGNGKPSSASRDEQISRGKMLQLHRGWAPWGACSRQLGLQ